METNHRDRRRAGRLACKIPVRVRASGRTLIAQTEDLSRVGALLRIPLAELGLPINAPLSRVADETTSALGDLAALELHYEILGALVQRMARPVRIGRGGEGQGFVEVGCAFRRCLEDAEVEFLGLPLPPLAMEGSDGESEEAGEPERPAIESPLSVVVCAAPGGDPVTPFAAHAELMDEYGAHAVVSHVSELPILPDRPGVSGLLNTLANTYGSDPWVVLLRQGHPVWSGTARLQSVELGPTSGRVDLHLEFSRALTAPERSRMQVG